MPSKNSIKQFVENGYYHLYNRGVEKRNIFIDEQDYRVFLSYLKKYLDPSLGSDPKSLANEITLLAFCLMPNHFHLQVRQNTKNAITKLMRAVCTCYSMYFNSKYDRVGALFQGKYKGVLITNDIYLLHLSRYIHLNPVPGSDPSKYPYSSYSFYVGLNHLKWVDKEEILAFFRSSKKLDPKDHLSYQSFVEDHYVNSEEVLKGLTLD